MAKVQAPFLSIGATGSIGGVLTAAVWKGIKTMRQKSNPANPNTAAQSAHRSIFASVVDFWRTAIIGSSIKPAWNAAASQSGKPQSGFNAFTSTAIAIVRNLATGQICKSAAISATTANTIVLSAGTAAIVGGGVPAATVTSARCSFGNTPGNLTSYATMDDNEPSVIANITSFDSGLSAGDTLYWQILATQNGVETAVTGIESTILT